MAEDSGSQITIIRVAGEWSKSITGYKRKVAHWCEVARAGTRKGALSIVLADDLFIRNLNHQYRGKNTPTNVLSFAGEDGELGDIVLGFETIKREAKAQGKTFASHTAHMVVHGILHLLGFDHENPADAGKMGKKEITILAKLGIVNPYEVQ